MAISKVSEYNTRTVSGTKIGPISVDEVSVIRVGLLITLVRLLSDMILDKWLSLASSKSWFRSPTIIILGFDYNALSMELLKRFQTITGVPGERYTLHIRNVNVWYLTPTQMAWTESNSRSGRLLEKSLSDTYTRRPPEWELRSFL